MTVLDELREAHRAVFRAVSAGPREVLSHDMIRETLVLLATIGLALADDELAARLGKLRQRVLEGEAALGPRGRGLIPVAAVG